MPLCARNAVVPVPGGSMDYIRFGCGKKPLILLPGIGDGLRTVKGTALPMAFLYRAFAKEFTVYCFSRRRCLPAGSTTKDMAHDLKAAMDALEIACADVIGVSMGGMIAQHLAADFPNAVRRLVLVVTAAQINPILTQSLDEWTACAARGDHAALMESSVRRMYTPAYYRKARPMIPLMGLLTKPRSYDRFIIQAAACRAHDAYAVLPSIRVRTLVIGGELDHALGGGASREIASQIPGAVLHMYPGYGHALYEEAKDFNRIVLNFLAGE